MKALTIILILLVANSVQAAFPEQYNVVWDKPSTALHDTMPIGNGRVGLTVAATADGVLHLTPAHVDAYCESHRLLKLGQLDITLSPNPFKEGFKQTLNIDRGCIVIEGANGFRAEMRVDANHDVFLIDAKADHDISMVAKLDVWRTKRKQVSSTNLSGRPGGIFESADTIVKGLPDALCWYHRNEDNNYFEQALELLETSQYIGKMPDVLENRTFGARLSGTNFKANDAQTLVSTKAKTQQLRLDVACAQTKTAELWLKNLKLQAEQPITAETLANHNQWWTQFWNKSWINLEGSPEATATANGYAHVMYLNALAGRGEMPIQWNGSIFTPDPRAFSSRYHGGVAGNVKDRDWRNWDTHMLHQNVRLPFYSMLAAGQSEYTRPYIDLYKRGLPVMRDHTRKVFGHDGAIFREAACIWGFGAPGVYGYDRSKLKPGQQLSIWHRTHWQSGLETAWFMGEYYAYTQDKKFATETLIPFADQALRFFDHHWPHIKSKDGKGSKLHIPHVYAMETFRDVDNPTPVIAGLHRVVQQLLALPETLTTQKQRTYWKALQARIPAVSTFQYKGKSVIAAASVIHSSMDNVEVPEYYAIFPYALYSVGHPKLELAKNTYFNNCTTRDDIGGPMPKWSKAGIRGGWHQDAMVAAMAGLSAEAKKEVQWGLARIPKTMRYPGYFETTHDWVPDVQHGSIHATALQRMLIQEIGDQIILLPAWPSEWDANFKLHAHQNTIIEGTVKKGKIIDLKVTPEARRKDVIIYKKPSNK